MNKKEVKILKSFSDNFPTPAGIKGQFLNFPPRACDVERAYVKNGSSCCATFNSRWLSSTLEVSQRSPYSHCLLLQIPAMNTRRKNILLLQISLYRATFWNVN
jgi:hypothetical protein